MFCGKLYSGARGRATWCLYCALASRFAILLPTSGAFFLGGMLCTGRKYLEPPRAAGTEYETASERAAHVRLGLWGGFHEHALCGGPRPLSMYCDRYANYYRRHAQHL